MRITMLMMRGTREGIGSKSRWLMVIFTDHCGAILISGSKSACSANKALLTFSQVSKYSAKQSEVTVYCH